MTRLVLHIDRLVLSGCSNHQRLAIAQGLREELSRQLAQPGTAQQWQALAGVQRLHVGKVRINTATAPTKVGMLAAGAIARGVAR